MAAGRRWWLNENRARQQSVTNLRDSLNKDVP